MPINRLLLGSVFSFDTNGVAQKGVAPAKVTSCNLRSVKGVVKFIIGLPVDPHFSSYGIYALDDPSLTNPGFPGGSPVMRDNASKPGEGDATAIVGVRRHYWIVTQDKYGTPNSPVAANAYWAGSIIPGNASTVLSGVG